MENIINIVVAAIAWLTTNYSVVISSVVGLFSLLIAFFLIIPGNQPEAFLQKIVDWLSKFSKK